MALMLIVATECAEVRPQALRRSTFDLDAGLLVVRGSLNRVDGRWVITEPKNDRFRRPCQDLAVSIRAEHVPRGAGAWSD